MNSGAVNADEARVLRLAAGPPADLFPVLHRDGAFLPLITLLAVLPGLLALRLRPFDESTAAWGLRAVEMVAAEDPREVIDPSGLDAPAGVRWSPPLASWLSAAVLTVRPAARRGGLFLVSYLSTAGLLLALFAMWRRVAGHRFAFWTAILAAFHGPFLQLAQDPSPRALALFLAVLSAGSYFRHALRRRDGFLSWALLASGILLGLCLLAGGSLALLVLAIVASWTLWQSHARRPGETRRPGLALPTATGGLAVLALTAFAVGGWWPAMMFDRHGGEFLGPWVMQFVPGSDVSIPDTWPGRLGMTGARMFSISGLLAWLAVSGLAFVVRRVWRSDDESDARTGRLLLCWLGVALAIWWPAHWLAGAGRSAALWDGLMLVPGLGLAAFGLEVIARGRAGLAAAATIAVGTALTGVPLAGLPHWTHAATSTGVWLVMAALAAALAILWWLREGFGERERLVRWAVGGLALAPATANAFVGLEAIDRRGPDERALSAVRDTFRDIPEAARCTVITASPDRLPLPLEYVLRSQWVRAEFSVAPNWDVALQQALAGGPPPGPPLIFVDWNPRGVRPSDFRVPGLEVKQLKSARVFAGGVVQGYVGAPHPRGEPAPAGPEAGRLP
ncbi:MAG: hypothetical protein WED34_16640 [Planctomycetales bacterium]